MSIAVGSTVELLRPHPLSRGEDLPRRELESIHEIGDNKAKYKFLLIFYIYGVKVNADRIRFLTTTFNDFTNQANKLAHTEENVIIHI